MRLKNSLLVLLITVVLFSCDKKRVFDEYKSVGSAWHKDNIVSFDLPQLDSTKRYNMFINIRDNDNYKYNNLFLIVSLELPNGYTKIDTLEYEMAEPDGTLLGNGFTDIKESKLFYKDNVRFRSTYKVNIKQAVRETGKVPGVTELDGITEVGLRIEKIE
ncbi:gliding motility-associated lipoprotein GldH [Flavobacterium sp. 7E]|uniref:gliding motility lipoprotein GldH n=1 Tax=unclassified Flavobacterium TaxID=196869 RepID=UPI0015707AEA|nr:MULTISPECIES: gliding motility lipoprotein GldH [unclassified Flavobacterium]MBE0392096.1 Gliding motility lipoprotein GldH [Flavobacterium sp. PL002]NRS87995.1 gliding motility-associated lipoprotein GldH [Flavobacterium sp. 7E]